MRGLGLGLAAASMALIGASAQADELRGRYMHFGAGQTSLNPDSVQLSVGGAAVPGADFDASSEYAAVAEVGMHVYGPWAVSFAWTSSMLSENIGTGSLAATPQLGDDSFMLGSVTAHYHFQVRDWFRPYVGAGLGYFHPTGAYDGVVTGLAVDDSLGTVLQAGADFDVTERWGAYVDVKQFLLDIEATGTMGGLPVAAKADLDPLLAHAGLAYRF